MSIIPTIKRWLKSLFRKERSDDLLSGVSATPDFPDPVSLIRWILLNYRQGIDQAACLCLEYVPTPFVRLTYGDPVHITINYSPPFSPTDRLKAIGVPLPGGFTLTEWKRHEHFTITGPRVSPDEMAIFIDLLFRKLYRAEQHYVMTAWTEIQPAAEPHPAASGKKMRREKS